MLADPAVRFALDTVRRAAEVVQQVQSQLVSASLTKGDKSPVTVGDFAAQAVVAAALERSRPTEILVGEEEASLLRGDPKTLAQVVQFVAQAVPDASPERVLAWIDRGGQNPGARFWTVDPIDGTKGFLRREQYAVCLALVVGGRVEIGVLGCPNLASDGQQAMGGGGGLFLAVRGQGAWSLPLVGDGAPRRIQVSDRADPAQARLLRSVESGHTNVDQMSQAAAALGAVAPPVAMDSQAKYAALACGQGDLLLRLLSPDKPNYREKIWDQAAGAILVEEAGGRISDLDGKPLDFSHGRTLAHNRGVVASNGRLHEAALAALKAVSA